ncbi:NADH dehydrogenase [ubiquinone] 1 beta subcomplex subunit 4 isoform X2 [Coregonus clupeaformis]|uniref:NADH dehydrogenase [ubiquinone] 1 beta subcomplex subunit 4 isoform X2 n=1 Tax=Coregonus clupeaformis TaxID=59861 RepID=UPI001BE08A85|nr:NADH dehydrogenase [ubiquinone] 1 beta subcomplex subunit 4 isoform X2 [Coregonus clupeaformis]
MADYREAPLVTRPKTLDPAEYFNLSLDQRRAEEERAGLRAQLKRQYQMQLNNPHRKELIEDPALTRWVYARTNPYNYFRATKKTSLLGQEGGADQSWDLRPQVQACLLTLLVTDFHCKVL